REPAVGRHRRPSVVENLKVRGAFIDHRLDRERHPFLQPRIRHSSPEVVGNLGIFMQLAPDPVPGELLHYRVSGVLRHPRAGAADIADAVSEARLLDSSVKRLARDLHQALRLFRDLTDRNRARRVAIEAMVDDAKVEPDDIARLELAARWNAVHDLVVD